MSRLLRQSTAVTKTIGPFDNPVDGNTAEEAIDAATADLVEVWKQGDVAPTDISATTTLTHRAGGVYTITFAPGDVDTTGDLVLVVRDDSEMLYYREVFTVVPATVYDSLISGTDALPVDAGSVDLNADQSGVTIGALSGHTPQTGDSYARLGAPAGASLSADLAAVDARTILILQDTGTTLPSLISAISGGGGAGTTVVVVPDERGFEPTTLHVVQGEDKTLSLACLGDSGGVLDLTGYTAAEFTVNDRWGGSLLFQKTQAGGDISYDAPLTGVVDVVLSAADTSGLDFKRYADRHELVYELRLTDGDGNVRVRKRGKLVVWRKAVTS